MIRELGKSTFLNVKAGGTYSYHCVLKDKELPADKIVERKSMNT
jgi:hypothetical protein